jgi:hypothetical protein
VKVWGHIACAMLALSGTIVACAAPNAPEQKPAPLTTEPPTTTATSADMPSTLEPTVALPTSTATAAAAIATQTLAPQATLATPDPNRNLGAGIYADTFDGHSGWFWTYSDDVASFAAKDGALKIETKQGNNTWRYVIRDDVGAGDQQIRVIAKATSCPGNDEYGLMYRAGYNTDQSLRSYVFLLNCSGQARVEALNNSTFVVLKDWAAFAAIRSSAPSENEITIWMAHDQFHFYVNNQYLFSVTDSTSADGFFGFFVASHSGGGGVFSFDDFSVTGVTAP